MGLSTYSSDDRFFVEHTRHLGNWALRIKNAREDDEGLYECQISSHPPQSIFIELRIVGKLFEFSEIGKKYYTYAKNTNKNIIGLFRLVFLDVIVSSACCQTHTRYFILFETFSFQSSHLWRVRTLFCLYIREYVIYYHTQPKQKSTNFPIYPLFVLKYVNTT